MKFIVHLPFIYRTCEVMPDLKHINFIFAVDTKTMCTALQSLYIRNLETCHFINRMHRLIMAARSVFSEFWNRKTLNVEYMVLYSFVR